MSPLDAYVLAVGFSLMAGAYLGKRIAAILGGAAIITGWALMLAGR